MKMQSPQLPRRHQDGLAIRCITTLPTLLKKFLRRGQDSNLQPQKGDGFQDHSTAVVHLSVKFYIIVLNYFFSFLAFIKLEIKHTIVYNDTNCINDILNIPLISLAAILAFKGINKAININKTKVIAI